MSMLNSDQNTSPKRKRVNPYIRTRRFTRLRFVLVLLVLSFASSVRAQDEATLAWKFEKGDELTVQFEQTQNVLTRIDVRDRKLESQFILVVDWNVTDVGDDGNATIEQTVQRIRIKTGAPGEELKKIVDVDTASEAKLRGLSRDMMKQVETLVGLKFVAVVSPTGKVEALTPDAGVAAVVAALPATSALRRVFSPAGMTKLIGDSAFALPEGKVEKGDSWTDDSTITLTANDGTINSFDRKVKSTVDSINNKEANFDVEVTLAQPEMAATSETALTSPLELQSFSGSGNVIFDRSTGTVTSSGMNTELKTRVIYRKDLVKTTTSVTNKMTVTRK